MNTRPHFRIFVSSVQKELAEERRAIKAYIEGDALLRQFFKVFLFEDLPASDQKADGIYLEEVDRSAIYLGLFGQMYGSQGRDGLSPTEREFDRATKKACTRLIYVKGKNDADRQAEMMALVRKADDQLIRRRFENVSELIALVYASLVDFLQKKGVIEDRPFDERLCQDATLDDLDEVAVASFVRQARAKRQFPLDEQTPWRQVLLHLGWVRENRPTHAAILLFGRNPQRFIPNAEVRCMHFHGTEIQRPAPFYRIFQGTLFSQVDQAANFVLSVTNLSVGTRALGNQAPTVPEMPPDVIREAVVNAVAHRDYTSGAAVQVAVFADRVEVWNPGNLPAPLTPESLRQPHRSIARNHRVCEGLFLAGYIEKYGTGTLMMIRESLAHSLPEPNFQQAGGEFSSTVWRDWLTEKVQADLRLNKRQCSILIQLKSAGKITNREYRQITGATHATAVRDLKDMIDKEVLDRIGKVGRNAYYVLTRKRIINDSNVTLPHAEKYPLKKAEIKGKTIHKAKPGRNTPQVTPQATPQVKQLLAVCEGELLREELQTRISLVDRKHFRTEYLRPALEAGFIEMTIPEKPSSGKQKYRLTAKGRAARSRLKGKKHL